MNHEWSVRVRTDSCGGLTASARNHSWRVGEPVTFAPKDELPSSLELAAGALAADILGTLTRICRLRRTDFDRGEFSLRITLENPLMYIGVVGEEGSPAIARIEGVAYISGSEEGPLREAWEEALRKSPLYNTLQRAAEINLRLSISY